MRIEGPVGGEEVYLLAPQPQLGGASVVEWLVSGSSGNAIEIVAE